MNTPILAPRLFVAMRLPFTQAQFETACCSWGCNCGPSALAFALQRPLDDARRAIPDFEAKGYTSPSMMRRALEFLDQPFAAKPEPSLKSMADESRVALVRIQWTGPWTKQGWKTRWAYGYTHWIATWPNTDGRDWVFDCNGGMNPLRVWESSVAPQIARSYERAYGGWYPTHVWCLERAA